MTNLSPLCELFFEGDDCNIQCSFGKCQRVALLHKSWNS